MQYFGETWDAPLAETCVQVPTPVGEPCLWCTLAITDGDLGVVVPGPGAGETSAYHRECLLAHSNGGMPCTRPGPGTPPEAVRRSAVALWKMIGRIRQDIETGD